MIDTQTLARPYAKAAYAFAVQHGRSENWSVMLAEAAQVVKQSKVEQELSRPELTWEKRAQFFVDLLGSEIDQAFGNFLHLLSEHNRLPLLPSIDESYAILLAEAARTVDVEIETAYKLEAGQLEKLVAALSKRLDRTVRPKQVVNPSLIGGVTIHAGDLVIDGSVRGKLNKLADALKS